ncbi:MAG: ShlB/FhaC/HecB family hemolysin secretion/activation protein [Candidatus Omnitrophica bacterium]|nr:ShlB/FhaC/HecB family hemolysin secretion/activation protein [Candidatus Omnitrophota bacterium]
MTARIKREGVFIRKSISAVVFPVILSAALINIKGVFAQESAETDKRPLGVQEELSVLKEKVGSLEKTVSEQAALIEQQRKILDKLLEVAPKEIKTAFTPVEPKTLVKRFVIKGANLFTAKDFEPVLDKYRDKEISMTDLQKAADEITGLYRKKGYITSLTYVPEQEITDNTVEFKVVEGRIGDIQVEAPKYGKVETIRNKFLVEKGQILDSKKLEVNLHRINKQTDRTMRAVLSPGATPETSNLLVKVDKEKSPQHFFTEFNNRGSKYTDKKRWGLGYVNNNLLGNDDMLAVKFNSNNQNDVYSGSAAYDMAVSRYNTRLGVYAAYSRADIGGQFAVLTPEGRAHVWGLYLSHPWLDKEFIDEATNTSMALTSNLTAGFDSISVTNKILGNKTSKDELRVAKVGINFEETDNLGRGSFSTEVHAGIPGILGAMEKYDVNASRMDAGGEFQKYTGSVTRITRLPASVMLINSFKGQYTTDALVNSAQMVLGGADTVRGFPEAEYLADYGWINTVELRAPMFLLPAVLKVPFDKKRTSLLDAIQLVGFIDAGKGYLNKHRAGEVEDKYLIGAGFGFRIDFYDHLRGKIDVGFPLGNEDPSDGSNSTVHFGLQYGW